MSETTATGPMPDPGAQEKTSTSLAVYCPRDGGATRSGPLRRKNRLARLKRAIVEGVYQIDSQRIAGKLLKRD